MRIVSLVQLSPADAARIRAFDNRIKLVEAGDQFQGEYVQTWPKATVSRYVAGEGRGTPAERDALLANADIVIAGFPFPRDLVQRAPQMRWMHQTPAGASNLRHGDIWGTDVAVTTSRGHGETTAIAEFALTGILHFLKGFDRAEVDRHNESFDHRAYLARSAEGKTLCVIGAGGIGREVARLGKAFGMRVLGTRRNTTLSEADAPFERVETPDNLIAQLAQSDFVAVCCQWTDETTNLINGETIAAMKEHTILVNVARGEIVDEAALLDGLDCGKLRGAVLDVYVGEFESAPPPRLWQHPKVLITPHTSAQADVSRRRSTDVFLTNLAHYLNEEPLEYRVDWAAGY